MKKIALSILSAAVLVGCVDARHVQDPQGKDYLHIKCSSLNTMKPVTAKCQARATKECPGGYTLLGGSTAMDNSVALVLKCDRDANNAAQNISSFAAYAKINHVSEISSGLISEGNTAEHLTPAPRQPAPTVATTTTEKTITSDKNGQKETVTKTTKVSKKEKKANH